MDEFPQDYEVFDLGDVTLQRGATLRDAKLAYETYSDLNADKSNAIVYPTWYSGRHWDNPWLIGDGMALTTDRHMRNAVVRLRASAASQAASDISATSSSVSQPAVTDVMPALFTSTSTRPHRSSAACNRLISRAMSRPGRTRLEPGQHPGLPARCLAQFDRCNSKRGRHFLTRVARVREPKHVGKGVVAICRRPALCS
jgi:hypothetical protein